MGFWGRIRREAGHAAGARADNEIAECKQTEETLRDSEIFLKSTLNALSANIAILDDAGVIIRVNAAWRRFAAANGWRWANDGLGANYLEVCDTAAGVDAAQAAAAARAIREIITHQRDEFYLEYPCHSPNEQRWFMMHITHFENNGSIRIVVAHENITERKQAEEALRASEERFRRLVESVTDYIYTVKVEAGRPVATAHGPACVTVTGYTPEEYTADPHLWYRMVYEEDRPAVAQQATQALSGEATWPLEHRLIHKDGSIRWVRNTPVLRRDDQGRLVAYDGLIADVTERKRAEETLRESEELHRITMEHILDPVFITDDNGAFTFICANVPHILGYTMPELEARGNAAGLVGDRLFDLEELKRLGEISNIERVIVDKHGRKRDFLITVRRVSIKGGTLLYVCRDITERKRAEQQLSEYTTRLRALSQRLVDTQEMERRSIARELHDEVGQVMLAVKTNLETMQLASKSARLKARLAESIGIVSRALEQIRALALDLRPSLLDDFGLRATLEWYLERQAKDAPFEINFQADLPDMRFPPDIEASCFRVTQAALTNIAWHAQATQVDVTLRWLPAAQALELGVRDNGIGFNVPAALKHARQGESLGLLGMQERIQLIGGQLAIESAPGRGTEIRARVPIKVER